MALQVTETHQENAFTVVTIVLGCVVGPNSAGAQTDSHPAEGATRAYGDRVMTWHNSGPEGAGWYDDSQYAPNSGGNGASWGDVFEMFNDWANGTAPRSQGFGPNTPQTHDMMNAPGVQRALDYFYTKNPRNADQKQQSVTDYAAGFGLKGLWQAGNNPTQQFVGNYRVDMYPNADGTISIQLTNVTSLTSFLYGLWPNALNMPNGWAFGNTQQVYYWTVPNQNVSTPARPPGSGAGGTW